MSPRRRRRVLRDDVLAPWVALLVILGFWWAGASLLGRSAADSVPGSASVRESAAPGLPASPATPSGVHTVVERASASSESPKASISLSGMEIEELRDKGLLIPVIGIAASQLRSDFDHDRSGGRKHQALDILAPRGTPIVAVENGRIARLFTSARGGLTIYQFDPGERYCYYYAHLDAYAADLTEGTTVRRGQTIGYVGTTGNAPPNTPHLHFAIFRLGDEKRWWDGTPLNPYEVLRSAN